jgi:hypothetical protein
VLRKTSYASNSSESSSSSHSGAKTAPLGATRHRHRKRTMCRSRDAPTAGFIGGACRTRARALSSCAAATRKRNSAWRFRHGRSASCRPACRQGSPRWLACPSGYRWHIAGHGLPAWRQCFVFQSGKGQVGRGAAARGGRPAMRRAGCDRRRVAVHLLEEGRETMQDLAFEPHQLAFLRLSDSSALDCT